MQHEAEQRAAVALSDISKQRRLLLCLDDGALGFDRRHSLLVEEKWSLHVFFCFEL